MNPYIVMRNIARTFSPAVPALRDVSLEIDRGEFVAIVGPSGSGKSTLLNLLGLLDTPTDGSFHLNGVDTADLDESARTKLRSRTMSFVFQAFHLVQHLTALENVELAVRLSDSGHGADVARIAREALQSVGLDHRADAYPLTLSGGEQQRVAVARALARRSPIIICDEPTGNLDSGSTRSLLDLLRRLHQEGRTVIVVTHDAQVQQAADRSIEIVDGLAHGILMNAIRDGNPNAR